MPVSSKLHRLRPFLVGSLSALFVGSSSLPAVSAPAEIRATAPSPLRVGVYYFPGWDESERNWDSIRPYPEREPLLGWYKGSNPTVMRKQLGWMQKYGLSYVAFDWYWQNGGVHADGTLKSYLAVPKPGVDFAILWCNDQLGVGLEEWRKIVTFWVQNYLKQPTYLQLKGQPVVFVLTEQGFAANAAKAKLAPAEYIRVAQTIARQAGLKGINFVAGFDDLSYTLVTENAPMEGFGAVSGYNFHRPPWRPQRPGWDKLTHGYPAMDQAYRENWQEGLRSVLPVVTPMTTGWDKRAWGGSADPLHDRSVATPEEFRAHLEAAKKIMMKPGRAHSGLGVVCCWNEYGEGSYLEPTKQRQFALLEQVRAVFGKR
jgi:hypothetical protein